MSLNLTNVTYNSSAGNSAYSNVNTNGSGNATQIYVPSGLTATQAGNALLVSLQSGDGFTGRITNITQNQITIALSDTVQITASLANALSYNIGDMASFTVKDNSGNQIILQSNPNPNLTSAMEDQTIQSALHNAGLEVNEKNASLVKEMMQQNISIDADTLNSYSRAMERTLGATPSDTVYLMKMDVPVTEENVSALHDLLRDNGFSSIAGSFAEDFTNSIASLIEQGQSDAGAFINDVLSSFSATVSAEETINDRMSMEDRNALSNAVLMLSSGASEAQGETDTTNILSSESNTQALKTDIQTAGTDVMKLAESIREGNLTSKDILTELGKFMQENKLDSEALKNFFATGEGKNLVEESIRQQMFLSPEDVTKENVKKLFAKVLMDRDSITEKLAGKADSSQMMTDLNQMKNNMDFTNQMNHFLNFVQLPVKFSGQNGHGDLYVYKNHHAKNSTDDELKAALHLDMDNLGPMDVIVKLRAKNVSTDFKVETDEILTFLEEHMGELNARLEALGYHVESNVESTKNNETYSFKKNVLEEEFPPVEIKRFSFDVRA